MNIFQIRVLENLSYRNNDGFVKYLMYYVVKAHQEFPTLIEGRNSLISSTLI